MVLKNEKLFIFVLALANFTNIIDFMIMMPLGPQLMRLWQITPSEFSLVVSSYTITAGVSGFAAAFYLDEFDRKKTLMLVYAGFILGTFACAFAPNFHILLFARALTGVFGGLMGAVVLSIVGDVIPLERRATAMGYLMIAFSLATSLGVPFGLQLANWFNWQYPFIFVGSLGIIVLILIYFNIPTINKHLEKFVKRSPINVIRDVAKNSNQLIALLLMLCLIFGQFSIIPFISPYLVSSAGLSETNLPLLYLFGGIATMLASPLVGKYADKYGRAKVFSYAALFSTIPLFIITSLPVSPAYITLSITTLFFIAVTGRIIPAMAMISATAPAHQRGSFMSISSSVQQLSAGIAAFTSGLIVEKASDGTIKHYEIVGYIAVFFTLCSVYIAQKVKVAE
jgi:DHA1 family inner membrane transport protein